MKLLRISITLIVLLLSCVLTNSQGVVFTPSQYYFSLQENTNSTLGPVYITSNTDITPSYSSSSSNFQVASSGNITSQAFDYEDQRILTTVISENTTTNTANVTICLTDVNDNSPTLPTPTALSISIATANLSIGNVIVRFYSSDADSNENGLVMFTTDSANFSLTTGGVLVNTGALAPGNYTAVIMAVDGGSPNLTSTSVFNLTIVDVQSLSLEQNRYAFTVNENATNNTFIGKVSPVGAVIALNTTDPSIAFNSSNDEIRVRPGLDYETRKELTFNLVNASATNTLLGTLVIYVINVEDVPPTLAQTTYDIILPIDTPANYAVWCIPPLNDGEEDAEVTYSLTNASNLFAVDTDGIITITSSIIDLTSGTVLTVNLTLTDRTQSSDVTLNFNLIASNPPLPGVPQSVNANNDNFTWTAPAGIYPTEVFPAGLLYQVTYRTLQNLSDIQTRTTNETILQTTLSQNDVYIYTVAASILNSNFSQTAVTTFATGTENTTATTVNSTAITVSFRQLQYCGDDVTVQYDVAYAGVELDTATRNVVTTITNQTASGGSCEPQSVTLTGLEEYVNYMISLSVTITELGVNNLLIAEVTDETFEAVSDAPLNLDSENITSTSFCVTFSPPTNITQNGQITNYTVTYVGELFDTTEVNETVSVSSVVYPLTESSRVCISDLEEYDNYTVLIRAVNRAGEGTAANITVETLEAVSTEPLNLASENITSTSFCVTFGPPTNITQNGQITNYTVTYVGKLFDTTEVNTTVSVSSVVYPLTESSRVCISDLEEYDNYTVLIRAVNGAGEGTAANITVETLEAVSTEPLNLASENITSTSFCVTFSPPTNITQNGQITNYTVTYVGELFDTTEVSTTVSVSSVVYPLTESSRVCISDLEEYDNYTVLIGAVNGAGEGTFANVIVETLEAAPTAAVQNVSEMEITSVSINVCFDPPTDSDQNGVIRSFNVTYFGSPFQTVSVTVTVPVVSTDYPLNRTVCRNLTSLQQNNDYNITVIAINSVGSGPVSQSIVVNTNESAPGDSPANVTLQTIDSQIILVTICPPAQMQQNGVITSYNVSYTGDPFDTTTRFQEFSAILSFPAAMCSAFNLTGLQEYNNYTINARAVNSAGSSDLSTEQTAQTNEAVSDAPLNLDSENITATYFCVTFDPPTNITQNGQITNYIVTYVGKLFDTTEVNTTVSVNSIVYPLTESSRVCISDLEEYDNYTVLIRAVNGAGEGTAANITVETSEAAPDGIPVNLNATSTTATSIIVCFEFPEGSTQNGQISSFNITLVGTPFDTESRNVSIATTSTEYPLNGSVCGDVNDLQEFNNYAITVLLINSIGPSPSSSDVQVQTLEALSTEPLNLASENITSTSFCVTFSPPTNITQNGQITNYIVTYVGKLFDTTEVNTTISVSSVVYPLTESSRVCISDLEEYDNYTVLIRAVNGAGEGTAANITVETSEAAPDGIPVNLTATSTTATSIIVCFEFPEGSTQNGPISSFNITHVGTPFDTESRNVSIAITSTEYPLNGSVCGDVNGLQEYNNYTITVLLINSIGPSPNSSEVLVQTLEALSTEPLNLASENITSTSFCVTFSPPTNITQNGQITNYIVTYVGKLFDTTEVNTTVSVSSVVYPLTESSRVCISNLEEYDNYTVLIRAVNGAGEGTAANITIETLEAVSTEPLNLASENITSTSFCVTFSPPTNITQNGQITNYTVTYVGKLFDTTEVDETVSISSVVYPLTESSSVCISDLEEYDNYTVSIRAVNGAGEGTAATITVETLEAVPDQPPQNITTETLNSTAIRVCLYPPLPVNQNGPITSFNIFYTGDLFQTQTQIMSVPVSPVVYPLFIMFCDNLTNLEEFNNYTITVEAVNSIGNGTRSDGVMQLTDEAAPSAPPQNFTATSGRNISLTYMPPPPIDQNGVLLNYTIEYFGVERDTSVRSRIVPASLLSLNITGLEEDTTYNFSIRASTSVGFGPFSDPITATTQAAPPSSPPVNITITVINATAFNSTWRIPDEDEHNGALLSVDIRLEGIDINTNIIINVPIRTNDTSFQTTILTPLEEYVNYSVIFAVENGRGFSPLSDPIFRRTDPTAPSNPPQNVETVAVSSTSISVTFYPPPEIDQNGPITSYIISYIGEIFDTTTRFETINITSPIYPAVEQESINLTGLQEYNNYTIRVRAVNSEGMSLFTAGVIQITDEAAPSNISQNVTTVAVNSTSIRVTFNPPPGIDQNGPITSYNISYIGEIFDTDTQFVTVPITNLIYPADAQVYFAITGLQEYNNYTVRVSAVNGIGSSEFTAGVIQITDEAAPNDTPQNIRTEAVSPTSIRVTFNPPPRIDQNGPITSYNISYTGKTFDRVTQFVNVPITLLIYPADIQVNFNLTGLQEYNNYTISVSAINGIGSSEFTAGVIQITDEAAPSNISQNVTTKAVSPTSIRVTFNPPPRIDQNGPITSYNISYIGEIFDKVTQFVNVPITNPIYPADAQVSFNLTGLQEYNNYNISVSAINGIGSSEFTAGVIQITDEAAPSNTPQNVATEALDPTSIRVTFYPPPGIDQNGPITSYNISYTGEIFDTTTQFEIINMTPPIYPAVAQVSLNLTGLQEYNNYTISVSAINGIGSSEFTAGVIQITNEAVPADSPTLILQSVSTTEISTMISPPSAIDQNGPIMSYEVRIYTSLFDIQINLTNVTFITSTYPLRDNIPFIATGLEEFVFYNLTVRAYTSVGPGEFSSGILNQTDPTAPSDTPQNTTPVALSPTSISVTFNPPPGIDQNGNITSYNISYTGEIFDDTTQFETINITNRIYPADAQVSFNLTGLQEYNNYNISVSAINGIGSSEFTAGVIQITDEAAPSNTPQNVATEALDPTSIRVTFYPPPGIDQNGPITSYRISYTGEIFDKVTQFVNVPITNPIYPAVGQVSFDLTGLQEYNNYTINVSAINGIGTSDFTTGVIQITDEGVSGAPTIIDATSSNPRQVCVLFTPAQPIDRNGDITRYFVNLPSPQISGPNSRTCVNNTGCFNEVGNDIRICFENLDEGTTYMVSVRAINGAGQGDASGVLEVMTMGESPPTGPPYVADEVNQVITSTSISLVIPFVSTAFLNSDPNAYIVEYQGFLFIDNLFPSSRRRRQSGSDIVAMTEVMTMVVNYTNSREISLTGLLPNYRYNCNVAIRTANGETPSVLIIPPTLITAAPTGPPINVTAFPVTAPEGTSQMSLNVLFATDFFTVNGPPDSFNIFYSTEGEVEQQMVYSPLNRDRGPYEITISNLPASSVYTVTVDVVTPQGVSGRSLETNAMTFADNTVVIVIILLLIIVILAVVIVILVILVIWYMRRRKSTSVPGKRRVSVLNSLKKNNSKSKDDPKEKSQENLNSGHVLPPPVIMKSTITISNFAKYVEGMAANDRLRFHEEYMSIKDPPHTYDMCSMSSNGPRNRYRDIRTYDHSRVALTIIDGDEYSDYINANFIHGYYKKNEYIAAQGPLDNTIADFWRVVWDWNVPTVVMLTKCVERGRRKCSQYWPDKGSAAYSFYDSTGSSREFVEVTIERETVYAHYIIREIMFTRVDHPNQMKRLIQWHYTSWPDMGVPENGTSLLKFVQKVHQAHPRDSGPMIVHCSAGVGRTGTFITLGCMMPMIREQSLVDVYNFVNRMRDSRNRMVQVEAQYVFIHEALLEFIQHGDTEVAGEDLDTYFRSLDTEEENGTSKLLGQFKRLAYPVRPTEYSVAQSAQNKAKNRYVNILPYNNKRVKLTPVPGVENSDYINASYIDGYWIKNAFIATQGPLQGTIEDFWKMIWEQHVNTIVMLTSEVEAGRERCAHYWPDEQPEYYGQIMVELVDTRMDEANEFIVHELKVTQTKENRVRKLNHFQYTGWHEREMPDSPTGLNNMIGEIDKFVRGTNPTHPIVIHCSAGVGRTGVFVGAFNMMESLRHDNTVDVFNTVRMMRYQRPAMVQTATQYRFCYIALMDFVSNSEADSVYQNVPKM